MAPQHPFVPHAEPVERARLQKPRPRRLEKRAIKAAQSLQWRELRRRVLKRDGGLCRVCKHRRACEAHHLLYRSLGGKDEARNLISVCMECHRDIHGHVVKLRWSNEKNRAGSLRIEREA